MKKELPLIRSHMIADYKRCPKKWYWKWLLGLTPKAQSFGALSLGTWLHTALSNWYVPGLKRDGSLVHHFQHTAQDAINGAQAVGAPDHEIAKADELHGLGTQMMEAYETQYGKDPRVEVIQAEIPLEFPITDENDDVVALYRLKPDLLYKDTRTKKLWLMEHKSAATIRTKHLVIDGQARPYGALVDLALRKIGMLKKGQRIEGIMYNFMRKAVPDQRPQNDEGLYLNKNGSVSKSQPPPYFKRHPVILTDRAKAVTLRRLRLDVMLVTFIRQCIKDKSIHPSAIPKTPHHSCERFCDYFTMCSMEEEGADISEMKRSMFVKNNPYIYPEDSTEDPASFEMG